MRLCKESDLRRTTKESTDKPEAGTRSKRLEASDFIRWQVLFPRGGERVSAQGSTGDIPRLGLRQGLMSAYPKRAGQYSGLRSK